MVNSKVILPLLCALAVVAVVAPVAHAGGSMGLGGDGTSTCRVISNGALSDHAANPLTNTFGDQLGTAQKPLKIGQAQLLCDLGVVGNATPGTNQDWQGGKIDPSDPNNPVNAVVCYSIPASGGQQETVKITDPFVTQTVNVLRYQFLCVPAIFDLAE